MSVDGSATQKSMFTALSAVFPAAVFPNVAPDQALPPYAVYQRIVSTPEMTLADGIPQEHDRFQVDIWGTGYDQVQQLAAAARTAMFAMAFPISVVLLSEADQYEADIKFHRVIQDYSIRNQRRI